MSYKAVVLLILSSLIFANCHPLKNNFRTPLSDSEKVKDTISPRLNGNLLAFELCEIYGADQINRKTGGFKNKWNLAIYPADTINFDRYIKFVELYGYPTKELVGSENWDNECVELSSSAILLHNPHRLINEKKYFDLFLNEVEAGRMSRVWLAEILDKYYWVKRDESGNRKLRYGTQWGKPCLKYRSVSDSVRMEIGLPPLKKEDYIDCSSDNQG